MDLSNRRREQNTQRSHIQQLILIRSISHNWAAAASSFGPLNRKFQYVVRSTSVRICHDWNN